jgi:pimeloyl-ACP methyl ester carboxylesterase
MRLYYETIRNPGVWGQPRVPVAMLMSSRDMFPTPREWSERQGKPDRYVEINRGGHFLEWEEPELVAKDICEFFKDLS